MICVQQRRKPPSAPHKHTHTHSTPCKSISQCSGRADVSVGVVRCALAHGEGDKQLRCYLSRWLPEGCAQLSLVFGKNLSMVGIPSSHADSRSTSNSSEPIAQPCSLPRSQNPSLDYPSQIKQTCIVITNFPKIL